MTLSPNIRKETDVWELCVFLYIKENNGYNDNMGEKLRKLESDGIEVLGF